MKKINIYTFIFVLLLFPASMSSQGNKRYEIRTDRYEVQKVDENIRMTVSLNLDNLDIPSQQMITITPVARSADRSMTHEFPPIIITGSTRDKALKRSLAFGNFEFPKAPQMIVRHYNNKPQSIPLTLELPYEEWLHEAELVFVEDVTGCACKIENSGEYNIANILPPLFIPKYELSYVTPPAEEVKRRSETYSARINFELNKYKILYNYKNNAEVLDEVDRIIKELRNDKNLTITNFAITGYASPEGVPQSNMVLSENRAHAFVTYLRENYNISSDMIQTDWKGEDWAGLRAVVADLYLDNKEDVLDILDNETDVMRRKSRLKQLNGGETYRMLLKDYYPPLRRNEYTIAYIAKPFSVDEAKETIRTKPQHLSENEMFLVANTYPKDSREFKEVFDIAAQIYPNNPYTQLNIITLDMEKGNRNDASIHKLQQINIPEAWNNLGIMYAEQGDYNKAEELFNKAANAGLEKAIWNKEQLSKFRENTINEKIMRSN